MNPYLHVPGDARWQEAFRERMGPQPETTRQNEERQDQNPHNEVGGEASASSGGQEAKNVQQKEKEPNTDEETDRTTPRNEEQEAKGARKVKGTVEIECVNITNLAYNWHALSRRSADIIFIREHKLRGKALTKSKEALEEAGWHLLCSPCDDATKKTNAGVGVLFKKGNGITVTRGETHTEALTWPTKREER